jgi:hypothetical protein
VALASGEPAAASLAQLDVGGTEPYRRALQRALRAEEAFGISVVSGSGQDLSASLYTFGIRLGFMDAVPLAAWRVFLLSGDLDGYRALMHKCQNLAACPYYEVRASWTQTPQQIGRYGLLASLVAPCYEGAVATLAESDAGHGLVRLAVAAARYRADKGKDPASVNDLVPQYIPAVPRDPFDGKPLRMVARGGGLVFYGVGRDLKDDGGVAWNAETKTGDVIFTLRRPPLSRTR